MAMQAEASLNVCRKKERLSTHVCRDAFTLGGYLGYRHTRHDVGARESREKRAHAVSASRSSSRLFAVGFVGRAHIMCAAP